MFGHGPFPWPDFCGGAGVEGEGVVGVVDLVPAAVLLVAVLLLLLLVPGAAAAPAMPEAAPAVARAPATIVAPSILDMVMWSNLLGRSIGCLGHRGAQG
jgi:hypothetical protein